MRRRRSRLQPRQNAGIRVFDAPRTGKTAGGRLFLVMAASLLLTGCTTSSNLFQTPSGGPLDFSSPRQTETLRKQVEKDPFPAAGDVLGKNMHLKVQ